MAYIHENDLKRVQVRSEKSEDTTDFKDLGYNDEDLMSQK